MATVIGKCDYCGSELYRDVIHSCEDSDREKIAEPLYAIEMNNGFALRDRKHRCVGVLTFRKWVTMESQIRVIEIVEDAFPRTESP